MAQQTYPVTAAGLEVPVWIGLDGTTTASLVAAGKPVAPPLLAKGLLDTGSNITALSGWLLKSLQIPAATTHATHTAAGPIQVQLYRVSLRIEAPSLPPSIWLTRPNLLVIELAADLPDADLLVGLDVLLDCTLVLEGGRRQFSLDF